MPVGGEADAEQEYEQDRQRHAAPSPVADLIETVHGMRDGIERVFQFLLKHGSSSFPRVSEAPSF